MEIFLSITGTALFGLLFYFLTIRKNTIKHFKINSYEIGRGLMDEFPKLNLSYDNKEIENNFIVLKGGFINSGWDIKGDDIEFDMILPETCNIVDVNIKPSNDKLKVISTIDNNKLHYEIEKIILNNDYFTYTIIVKSDEVIENIGEKLIFKHRMYKTKKITTGYIFQEVPTKKEMIVFFLVPLLLEIMCSYLTVVCYNNEGFSISFFFFCFVSLFCIVILYFTVLDWKLFKSLWGVLKNK